MDTPRIFLCSSGKQEKPQALTRGLEDVAIVATA